MAATMGPTAPEGGLNRRARKALAAKAHREENQRVTATLFVRNLSFEYVNSAVLLITTAAATTAAAALYTRLLSSFGCSVIPLSPRGRMEHGNDFNSNTPALLPLS
jgi:hypothetical protein